MHWRSPARLLIAALLAAVVLAAIGCTRSSSSPPDEGRGIASAPAPGTVPEPYVASQGAPSIERGADAIKTGTPQDRMVVRTAALELRVERVEPAVERARATAARFGGEIAELSVSGAPLLERPDVRNAEPASPRFATIVIRIEAARLDRLAGALRRLGTVVSQTESTSDVTEQAIDLEARLENLRAQEKRLRTFFDRATKVSDLIAIERELARVRAEIESYDAQLTLLKRQVAKATLTVTLTEPTPVTGPDRLSFRLREAVVHGVQSAIGVVESLITALIAALPVAIIAMIVAWAIIASIRRRKRAAAETADAAASESAPPTDGDPH